MYNYRLKAINEKDGHAYLETPFYWGPGLPVFSTEEEIKNEIEINISGNADQLITSGVIELYWIDERSNVGVLSKLLSSDPGALFLPEQYRKQVINAKNRKQPFCFFIERGIRRNHIGDQELRLRQSCEAEPHRKGYKYGYSLSIVLGEAIHEVKLDGDRNVISTVIHENKILPNAVFKGNT